MTARTRFAARATAIVGIVWGLAGEYFSIHNHANENHVLDFLVGAVTIVAGSIAWERRPDSKVGKLLVASGFAWFFGNYSNAHNSWAFSLGNGLMGINVAPLAHAFLSYPDGKLSTWAERATIAALYTWLIFAGVITIFTADPRLDFHCSACPHGALAFIHSGGLASTVNSIDNVMTIVLPALGIVLIALRFRRETPAVRRTLTPLWVGAVALTIAFLAQGIGDALNLTGVPESALSATQRMFHIAVPLALLYGLLRIRLVRSSIGDMVVSLGEQPGAAQLREALARTLGDPNLALAYALPDGRGFIDEAGHAVALPGDPRAHTILKADGEAIAALIHDPVLSDRPEVVEAAGAAARLAIQNERLRAEVRAQLEEVRASRARIVEAGDAERRRVERDLHDGAQQRLLALSLALRMAEQQLGPTPDPELLRTVNAAKGELDKAIDEIRELARGIHPAILTDEGLGPALESLAERAPIPTRVVRAPDGRFSAPVEVTAYFVVSEALANAAKHSSAREVMISSERRDGRLVVSVSDDGRGGADPKGGTGLSGLSDRVAAVGGLLRIDSREGMGTQVVAEIPCV